MTALIPSLATYASLGRSGLRVSPLCLGAMTFGTDTGWGCDEATSRALFTRYLEAGGNFVDTADGYTGGRSEEMVGRFLRETGSRDRVVLATKWTMNLQPGNPNSGGNGRKNLYRALDASLKRLQTDHVDLYWMHAWDVFTPVEEVMAGLDAVVRAGKVRYIGFSDVPAWYLARAQTLAEWHGWERVIALQLEYSLIERSIEREHVPAARALGMGICPWSPLGGGFLSGKYVRNPDGSASLGGGRLDKTRNSPNPVFQKFNDRNFAVLDALTEVARALGRSPSQVALAWATRRPGITSTILGATRPGQLEENLQSLSFEIPEELLGRLDAASALPLVHPYAFFQGPIHQSIHGGVPVAAAFPWDR